MPSDDFDTTDRLSRRSTLIRAGGLAAAALGVRQADGRARRQQSPPPRAARRRAHSPACLSPEMTDGPYYLPGEKVRRDITEGLPGAPLTLRLSVLDADKLPPDQGRRSRHLACERGGQVLGRGGQQHRRPHVSCAASSTPTPKGLALFKTVYPGWYPGRAVHIHVKVHVRRRRRSHRPVVLPRRLHGRRLQAAPYRSRGARDVRKRRLDLRQRREPLAARPAHGGERLRRAINMGVRQ